jgi:HEPN domain-containing protein
VARLLIVRCVRDGCLPTPEQREVARLLLEKAAGDLSALKTLADDESQADHVIGLLAQQTVEKSLKAALAICEVEIPRTHDLGFSRASVLSAA